MRKMRLFGTKEAIFDEAVKLISSLGYESVNMRNIAASCGIRAPSIYNHFLSKQEILKCIYDYYEEHFLDNFKSDEEIKLIIEKGPKEEIIQAFAFTFEDSDERKYQRMILITKIIYTRNSTDNRAGEIFFELMTHSREKHLKEMMDYGVAIGRFKPFDTKTYAALFSASRHFMGIKAFNRANYAVGQLEEETDLNAMLATLLPMNE